MKRYFMVGTDTDCGKTYVTCQLAHNLQSNRQRVLAVKPIASGCNEKNGVLTNDDVFQLDQVNGESNVNICPWRLKLPIAPHLAAMVDKLSISAQAMTHFCDEISSKDYDYVLIEGAGGLLVPLNDSETWVDFLIDSQIPVILVVGMRLGCINHALLTASVLKHYSIECSGWVANCIVKDMLMLNENIQTLEQKLDFPLLTTIAYQKEWIGSAIHCLY